MTHIDGAPHERLAHGWPRARVWHRQLTEAAEQGGAERLAAALAAQEEVVGHVRYFAHMFSQCRHADAVETDGGLVPASPFSPLSRFGILPYAVWHGHPEIVRGFVRADARRLNATAQLETEPYLVGQGGNAHMENTVRVTALQIAFYKRDAAMVQVLVAAGAELQNPFLLDIIPPLPGSLFATKAGSWSVAFHQYYPPAFKAAAAELLRISRKHGGTVSPAGQLRWPFIPSQLIELLLPLLGANTLDWLDAPVADGDSSEEEDYERRTSKRRRTMSIQWHPQLTEWR